MPVPKGEAVLREMRTSGVLQDVDAHRIDARQGIVLVTCGDGDQSIDILEYLELVCLEHRLDSRIHLLCLNGGALNLPQNSPLNRWFAYSAVAQDYQRPPRDAVLLDDIFAACKLKEIQTVILLAHAPCGAARTVELSFEETVRLLVEAKRRIKMCAPDMNVQLQVACFYHVCWESGDDVSRRTYFVSAGEWDRWVQRVRQDASV